MENNSCPRISVVTPSYNQGQFLEETILSVLNQDYPSLEYIIIDGGSTDNSVEIIKKYEDRLAYWVSEPDKGQSDAINKGFRMATGKILAWLNSDDVYLHRALEIVAEYFQSHSEVGCVYGDIVMIRENGGILYKRKTIPFNFRMALYGGCLVPQPATFFRRSALERTGELDITLQYQMDFDFFLRMASRGVHLGNVPIPLAKFRLHRTSKTVSEYGKKVEQANRIIRRRYSSLRLWNDKVTDSVFVVLKWVYKLKGFLVRAITRGDALPFKGAFFRRTIQK